MVVDRWLQRRLIGEVFYIEGFTYSMWVFVVIPVGYFRVPCWRWHLCVCLVVASFSLGEGFLSRLYVRMDSPFDILL